MQMGDKSTNKLLLSVMKEMKLMYWGGDVFWID